MTGRFTPVIPRDLRLEVPERTDARGRILTPLDEAAIRAAVARLLAAGCESLVIHFLHAYANPAHELRAAAIAAELWPNPYITTGHSLLSESREYERGVTAAVNAAVQPLLERYLARLQSELTARGYPRDLLVVTGNGGMVSARTVAREAAKTVMSGPASGVMAAVYTARRAGIANLITYDMGGTSTDVALIRDGAARGLQRDRARIRHADPRPDGRRPHRRRRRRLDRPPQRRRPPRGRPRVRRRRPRPDRLRPRRHPPHHHRRQPPPRPPRPRPLPRRRRRPPHPRRHPRPPRSASPRRPPPTRSSASPTPSMAERHPHGLALPRRRPPRLHPLRLRRRRPAARRRARPRARPPPRPRPRPPRHHQRARLRRRRPPPRLRPHPRPPPRRPRHRRRSTPSSPSRRPKAAR